MVSKTAAFNSIHIEVSAVDVDLMNKRVPVACTIGIGDNSDLANLSIKQPTIENYGSYQPTTEYALPDSNHSSKHNISQMLSNENSIENLQEIMLPARLPNI